MADRHPLCKSALGGPLEQEGQSFQQGQFSGEDKRFVQWSSWPVGVKLPADFRVLAVMVPTVTPGGQLTAVDELDGQFADGAAGGLHLQGAIGMDQGDVLPRKVLHQQLYDIRPDRTEVSGVE